jgi:hypothetical protein
MVHSPMLHMHCVHNTAATAAAHNTAAVSMMKGLERRLCPASEPRQAVAREPQAVAVLVLVKRLLQRVKQLCAARARPFKTLRSPPRLGFG